MTYTSKNVWLIGQTFFYVLLMINAAYDRISSCTVLISKVVRRFLSR